MTFVAVLIAGLGIGAAIAGRPTAVDNIRISSVPSTTSPATTTLAPAPTAVAPSRPVTTTTAVTTVGSASTTTAVATVVGSGSTTTAPAVRIAPTTTTTATTTTTPEPDRSAVQVLVVNAGNRSGIARAEAAYLVTLGYTNTRTDDAHQPIAQTTVYARAGGEDAALVLLADAGLAADRLRPFPGQSIATLDDWADLILALGIDWQA